MKTWMTGCSLGAVLFLAGNAAEAPGGADLKNDKDKASYMLGQNIGASLRQQRVDSTVIDLDIVDRGVRDGLAGVRPALSEKEIKRVMTVFQESVNGKAGEGDKNSEAGEDFLQANAKKPGVVTLPSGLQYKILKRAGGPKPLATDVVTVNYVGTLIDGTEFDNSVKRGQPASFPVNGVIAGWTEALQLMPKGSKWRLFIPSALAYGEQGAGDLIGPNATLIFDVELISIAGAQK